MNDKELIQLEEYLNQKQTKSCSELILAYIDRYFDINNLSPKDSYIYKKADIDRRLFSKFKIGDYNLSKNNIIKLCIALELDINETNEVLESAGYTLSTNKVFDLILRYYILNKDFDLSKINEQLYTITKTSLV